MIVADTDVLIDALQGVEPAAGRIRAELSGGSLATTAINAFELLSGAREADAQQKIHRLLRVIEVLPADGAAGIAAAEIRRTLEAKGLAIGQADYLIAGVCVSCSLSLLTRNRKHFERVSALQLVDLPT